MEILFLLALVAAIILAIQMVKFKKEGARLSTELKEAQDKLVRFSALSNVEDEVTKQRRILAKVESDCIEKKREVRDIEKDINSLSATLKAGKDADSFRKAAEEKQANIKQFEVRLAYLSKSIGELEESANLQEFGFYKNRFDFIDAETYKKQIEYVKDQQKLYIKDGKAAFCSTAWTVSGSAAEGKKMTDRILKLLLRAFNGECDAAISKVKYNNVNVQENRIIKSFEAINKLGAVNTCEISAKYKDLRLKELYLTHEYHEKVQEEREEQRAIQEQIREEQRAERELEKAQRDAEKREEAIKDALEKAKFDMELAEAAGKKIDRLNQKVQDLMIKLQEAVELKQRAISQAQLTKCGHVYIISNIGSFGHGVYKIGMTRRLDPMDRVKELGDASVPFPFDVHAMIYCEDAPALENALHKAFDHGKLNRINNRKEFFYIGLDDIEKEVTRAQPKAKIHFTKIAKAEEYRRSLVEAREMGDIEKLPPHFKMEFSLELATA